MKKSLTIVLTAVLLLSLTACGGNDTPIASSDEPSAAISETPTEPEVQEIALGDAITADGFTLTLHNFEFSDARTYRNNPNDIGKVASEGNVWVVVNYDITNTGRATIQIPNVTMALDFDNGIEYPLDRRVFYSDATDNWVDSLLNNQIDPLNNTTRQLRNIGAAAYQLRDEIDKPLSLHITIAGVETDYVYTIR